MARSARMIGIGGAIPTSSRRFSFPDRSEKGLLDYGIAWPIWGAPADRPTGRFPRPDRRGESYEPYPDPGQPPSPQQNAADRSSGCWNGGFAPESGSFTSTESKPSDVTIWKTMGCDWHFGFVRAHFSRLPVPFRDSLSRPLPVGPSSSHALQSNQSVRSARPTDPSS